VSTTASRAAVVGGLVFVVSDGVTFAALLGGALALRAAGHDWPSGGASLAQLVVLSALLFAGSAIIALARRGRPRALWLAAALALAFVGGEVREWLALVAEQHGPGADLHHASLFVVTGLHALHVTIGALVLGWFGWRRTEGAALRVLGYYWLALDVAWLGIVAAVYR
jgi:cytochrome o ubiquinol oxidase subunit 3